MDVSIEFIEQLKLNRQRAKEQYESCSKLLHSYGVDVEDAGHVVSAKPSGLRAAISHLLKNHPEGLRTGEVVTILKSQKLELGGKTKFSTRVSIELYTMKQAGLVKQIKGKYRLS